jgi:hypothetical protein
MAKQLILSGITTGGTIEASHVSQSVNAFTGADAYDIKISGSLVTSGSLALSGSLELTGLYGNDSTNDGSVLVLDPSTNTVYVTGSYGGAGGGGAAGPQGGQGTTGTGAQGGQVHQVDKEVKALQVDRVHKVH